LLISLNYICIIVILQSIKYDLLNLDKTLDKTYKKLIYRYIKQ